jgi:hypothetical protein
MIHRLFETSLIFHGVTCGGDSRCMYPEDDEHSPVLQTVDHVIIDGHERIFGPTRQGMVTCLLSSTLHWGGFHADDFLHNIHDIPARPQTVTGWAGSLNNNVADNASCARQGDRLEMISLCLT